MVQSSLTTGVPNDVWASRTARPRLLVIEADSSERSVLSAAFAAAGFEVVSVETGAQAVRRLSSQAMRFNAVLIDAALRGEDGYSLCAQIKGDTRIAEIPVWLLSPKKVGEDRELGQVVGAEGVIGKPTYVRDVVALVRLKLAAKSADGIVTFDTESLPLGQLLRAVLSAGMSGTIGLPDGSGSIRFRGPHILDAHYGGINGSESLIRAMALATGSYSVRISPQPGTARFYFTLTELVSTAFPRLLKWNEVRERSVPLDAKLGVDFGRLKTALATLPDGVNDVVRLFDGKRTVRQVVIDSTLSEATSLAIATRLYVMGVIVPMPDQPQGAKLASSPGIFEPKPLEALESMVALFQSGPVQVARVEEAAPAADWYKAPTGSGLETGHPTDGWTAMPIAEAAPEVMASVARQVEAFNLKPVVETAQPTPVASELSAFTQNQTVEPAEPQGLEAKLVEFEHTYEPHIEDLRSSATTEVASHAAANGTAAIDALEMDFFRASEVITKPEGWVARAVLGITAENEVPQSPDRNPLWLVGALALALVTVTAFAAWSVTPRVNRSAPLSEAIVPETNPSFAPELAAFPPPAVWVPPTQTAEVTPAAEGAPAAEAASEVVAPPPAGETAQAAAQPAGAGQPAVAAQPGVAAEVATAKGAAAPNAAAGPGGVSTLPAATVENADIRKQVAEANAFYEKGRLKQAIAALEAVIAAAPSDTQAWLLLGLARFDAGDRGGAEEAAMTTLALEPGNARAHLLLASVALETGRKAQARAELENYLRLDPSGPFASEAKSLLQGK